MRLTQHHHCKKKIETIFSIPSHNFAEQIDCIPYLQLCQLCDVAHCTLHASAYTLVSMMETSSFHHVGSTLLMMEKVTFLNQPYIKLTGINANKDTLTSPPSGAGGGKLSQLVLRGISSPAVGGVYRRLVKRCLLAVQAALPAKDPFASRSPSLDDSKCLFVPGGGRMELVWSMVWGDVGGVVECICDVMYMCMDESKGSVESWPERKFCVHVEELCKQGNKRLALAGTSLWDLVHTLSMELVREVVGQSTGQVANGFTIDYCPKNFMFDITLKSKLSIHTFSILRCIGSLCEALAAAYKQPALQLCINKDSRLHSTLSSPKGFLPSKAMAMCLQWIENIRNMLLPKDVDHYNEVTSGGGAVDDVTRSCKHFHLIFKDIDTEEDSTFSCDHNFLICSSMNGFLAGNDRNYYYRYII